MNDFKRKTREFIDSERFSSSVVIALVIAVVMVFNALLFTVVEMFGLVFYYDKPFDYSITGSSDELFDEAIKANKKVKIYFCMSESELKAHSTGGEVYVTAKKFEEKYPEFIELDYLNILTKQDKDGNFIDLDKYRKHTNLSLLSDHGAAEFHARSLGVNALMTRSLREHTDHLAGFQKAHRVFDRLHVSTAPIHGIGAKGTEKPTSDFRFEQFLFRHKPDLQAKNPAGSSVCPHRGKEFCQFLEPIR